MNIITNKTDNVGKEFAFVNGFPITEGVILENIICTNESLGTKELYKVFYKTSDNKARIKYVPHEEINVSYIDSSVVDDEITLRQFYRWSLEDIEDYWYNFVNYNRIKV